MLSSNMWNYNFVVVPKFTVTCTCFLSLPPVHDQGLTHALYNSPDSSPSGDNQHAAPVSISFNHPLVPADDVDLKHLVRTTSSS